MLSSEVLLSIVEPLAFASIGVLVGIASNRFQARWTVLLSSLGIALGVIMNLWPDLHAGQVTRLLRTSADQIAVEVVIPVAGFFFVSFATGRYAGRVAHWAVARWERRRA